MIGLSQKKKIPAIIAPIPVTVTVIHPASFSTTIVRAAPQPQHR
ncbi:hypothetical protein ANO14919_022130 [Xylariales sp. No.14919]|nr:hypothetical protein ANO14919_022130 [Xylariales sp. No.14919]